MRILVWFTIGFAAACAAAVYWLELSWLLPAAGICLLGVALFFIKHKHFRVAAVVFVGLTIGFLWNWGYSKLYLADAISLDGQKLQAEITVTDYAVPTDTGTKVNGKIQYADKTYKVTVFTHTDQQMKPGDKLLGEALFRYTPRDRERNLVYYQGDGVFLSASLKEYQLVEAENDKAGAFSVRLRYGILQLLDQVFPEDTAAFARALLLGDDSRLTYEIDNAFAVSGIRHIIAVSGLHVTILLSLVQILCWHRRPLVAAIGIPVLILFAAVAGFTPSVVRACIMQGLIILAMALIKEYDPPIALAFSVLVLLVVSPMTIASVGFQLSVACIIAIQAFSGRIYHYLASRKWIIDTTGKSLRCRLARAILSSLSISFSVWIVTTPLCVLYFGMVSIVSVFTNLLTVWMISYIFYMIMAACVLGVIWLPLGIGVAWLTSWPIRLVQLIAVAFSKIPFSAVYTVSDYIALWVALCYILLGVFVLLRFRKPAVLLSCMVFGLVLAVSAACIEERLYNHGVSILDVGEGQCVILKYEDRHYMVDCGGDDEERAADTAAEYLLSKGILYLDGVIVTHYDRDHAGGVANLLTRVPALRLYLPSRDSDCQMAKDIIVGYEKYVHWIDDIWGIPQAQITLIGGNDNSQDNESSICVLFQPENYDILITGDRGTAGEQALMERIDLPQLELLVAGHHGANGATGLPLLEKTMPVTVVISVGRDNRYGHPAAELLQRLELFRCQVLRTDQLGTIEFKG